MDFYCAKAKLIVELDGSQHYEEHALQYDRRRAEYFASLGLEVLRFTNCDVDDYFEGVCLQIDETVKQREGILSHLR